VQIAMGRGSGRRRRRAQADGKRWPIQRLGQRLREPEAS
jgi:hypothetical protein